MSLHYVKSDRKIRFKDPGRVDDQQGRKVSLETGSLLLTRPGTK